MRSLQRKSLDSRLYSNLAKCFANLTRRTVNKVGQESYKKDGITHRLGYCATTSLLRYMADLSSHVGISTEMELLKYILCDSREFVFPKDFAMVATFLSRPAGKIMPELSISAS